MDDFASSVLRFRGLKFLKALRLDSCRAFVLLNPFLPNALGRLLLIGVWGWVNDTWRSLISDTFHSLIGPLMSSLTRAGLLVSSLTRAKLLVSSLTHARLLVSSFTRVLMRDWFLHDTWQISVGF